MSAEPLRGLHVLVVDDDAAARTLVASMLAHCGALVTETASAETAWQSLARLVPEIIVCALNLGGGRDAHELLRRIKATAPRPGPNIPVVAMARDNDLYPINEVLEAGFAGYVKAPFDPRQLCVLIADVADAHPREDQAT